MLTGAAMGSVRGQQRWLRALEAGRRACLPCVLLLALVWAELHLCQLSCWRLLFNLFSNSLRIFLL